MSSPVRSRPRTSTRSGQARAMRLLGCAGTGDHRLELTERELLKTLEKNGVKKFSPQGEKFDPNVHQAMYEIPTSDLPPGQVAEVIQAGYMIGERVLRPAMVAVSKAVQKTPASANDNS